jgi:hypothetical protein
MNLQIKGILTKIPTEEDIKNTGKELGIDLPPSYIKFVKEYGAGQLCGMFLIYVPGSEKIDLIKRSKRDTQLIAESVEYNLWDSSSTKVDATWLKTLVPFGSSSNGDILCWDINQKFEEGEYPIVFLEHEQECAVTVAKNIEDFITNFCLANKIDEVNPIGNGEKWNLTNSFEPI